VYALAGRRVRELSDLAELRNLLDVINYALLIECQTFTGGPDWCMTLLELQAACLRKIQASE